MSGVAQLPTPPAGCRDVNGVCGLGKLVVRASFCNRLHSVNLRTFRAGRSGQSVPEHIGVAGLWQQGQQNATSGLTLRKLTFIATAAGWSSDREQRQPPVAAGAVAVCGGAVGARQQRQHPAVAPASHCRCPRSHCRYPRSHCRYPRSPDSPLRIAPPSARRLAPAGATARALLL